MVFLEIIKIRWRPLLFTGLMMVRTTAFPADLLDVYQLALQNDAHLQATHFQFKASSEAVDQAIADLLPSLSFDYTHTESRQEIISSQNRVFASAGVSRFPIDVYNIKLNVPVFHYDAWARFSQTDAVVAQARSELLAAEQQLIIDVAQTYFDILQAHDDLLFSKAESQALRRELELAEIRLQQGLGIENDLLDIQARLATARMNEIEAENNLQDSLFHLQEFTRRPVSDLAPIQEDIPLEWPESDNAEDWLQRAYTQNHKLRARRFAVQIAEEETRRQFAGHLPTVDLVGALNNRETGGSLFGGGSEVQTFDISLQVNVPLFQGGKIMSKTREAEFVLSQRQKELEAEQRSLARNTQVALQGILSGIQKISAATKVIRYQKSLIRHRQEELKAGLNTMQAVLDARRDLYNAQRDYASARYGYLLSILKLKQSSGTLSPQDLARMDGLFNKSKNQSPLKAGEDTDS